MSNPQIEDIREAVDAVRSLLDGKCYAIIGGAALVALGMTVRTTRDVDILVLKDKTREVKDRLGTHSSFELNRRTRHLTYTARSGAQVEIDVLAPQLAYIPFDTDFPIYVTSTGVRLASPIKLLDYKIKTAYNRSSDQRRATDWSDVQFLIDWHVRNTGPLEPGSCPNATRTALNDLRKHGHECDDSEWQHIGGSLN